MTLSRSFLPLVVAVLALLPAATSAGEAKSKDEAKEKAKETAKKTAKEKAPPYSRISKEVLYDGYGPYLEVVEALYLPPTRKGDKQTIRLLFNIWPDVPTGAVIRMTLEYLGMDYVTTQYKVEEKKRTEITLDWTPKMSLVPGDYFLRSRIPLEDQTATLRQTIKRRPRRFPPEREPWPFLFMTEELRITVGREFTDPAEKEEVRKIYEGFINVLRANLEEYTRKMDAVREGKELVEGEKLDMKGLEEFVIEWRKKQGAIQQKISEFEADKPSLFLRTRGAFLRLRTLGRMISKRAWQLQKEVTKKYGEKPLDPRIHQFYARHYRLPVTDRSIERTCDTILGLLGLEESDSGEGEPKRASTTAVKDASSAEKPPD